ncbi:MAG TPA: sigma-70 family RNA polymerase sigma factor [Tepidisphaeraceae bacterium]
MGQSDDEIDDYVLMRRIAARDQAALRTLYDRHAALIYALLRRIVRNREDADELLSDIFWEAWMGRFDESRACPRTYLVMLARSRAIDRLRSRGRQVVAMQIADSPAPPGTDAAESREVAQIVRSALDALDSPQRQMIEYAFYDGMSHSEIAAKTQQPLGTVKTYIRRGLIRLRDSLRTLDRNQT